MEKIRLYRNGTTNKIQRGKVNVNPKRGDIHNTQLGGAYYNPVIICITGYKGSGKTLVGKMISYIVRLNSINKNFRDFSKFNEDERNRILLNNTIINFGDFVKKGIQSTLGISTAVTNDRYFKEEVAVRVLDGKYICLTGEHNPHNLEVYTGIKTSTILYNRKRLDEHGYVPVCPSTGKLVIVPIRLLMQYHGDMMKKVYGNEVFARRGRLKIKSVLNKYGYAIVADCRYKEEIEACKSLGAKVYVINIDRDAAKPLGEVEHSSEENSIVPDFVIDNNASLLLLYYKVQELISRIKIENKISEDNNVIKRY